MTTNTIERYRLARPGDEGRECWVNSVDGGVKQTATITGFYKGMAVTHEERIWAACFVADEAPDPGEGYRLLKKMEYDGEEEEVIEGDEWWDNTREKWRASVRHLYIKKKQGEQHYRRRIEPEKPVADTPVEHEERENMTTNTIKRYRAARPGDEGRACYVSDDSQEIAVEHAKRAEWEPSIKVDGFYKGTPIFLRNDGVFVKFAYAIVADEAPDPGEGYRLLKKQEYDGEEEQVQAGDEFFKYDSWIISGNNNVADKGNQSKRFHYRRRIEPEKPAWTPKVGDWVKVELKMEMNSVFISYPQLVTGVRDGECHINGVWVSIDKCTPAEQPQQSENDLEKQVEFAKAEFEKWPQWKKDLALNLLSPKPQSNEPTSHVTFDNIENDVVLQAQLQCNRNLIACDIRLNSAKLKELVAIHEHNEMNMFLKQAIEKAQKSG